MNLNRINPARGLKELNDSMGSKRIIMYVGIALLVACVVVHLSTGRDIQPEILFTLSAMILGLGIANAVKDSQSPQTPNPNA